jgi:hypothetical protein
MAEAYQPKTNRPPRPDTFLVRFVPKDHNTYRISVVGRELDKAMEFAQAQKAKESTKVAIVLMDGLNGEIKVQEL